MATVVLEKLLKTYADKAGGAVPVVHGIDLEVRDREFMVLVGPSGCGKSTTLRMIAGLESISGGRLLIDGREMNQVAPKDRDIAMVFQNYALYPHMTVFENMAFGLTLRKLPKAEITERVKEASALLGLDPYLERRPKALSGGQRQRVAVGRAIVRKPKVFLFDEPLSNLDAKMRVSTRAEISKLHERLGATMIYVTHDQVEAMTMGDRICVMKDGRIMQVAEPLELYNRPANLFVAGFIGSPPMNTVGGTLVSDSGVPWFVAGEGTPFLRVALTAELAERARQATTPQVVLGIRPEDIHAAASAPAAWPRVSGRVEVMEPLGAETYVYATAGSWSFIARLPPQARHAAGSTVDLALDPTKLHLFDAASERALQ